MRDRDDVWVTNSSNGNNHQRKRMTGKLTGLRDVSLGSMTRAAVANPDDRAAA